MTDKICALGFLGWIFPTSSLRTKHVWFVIIRGFCASTAENNGHKVGSDVVSVLVNSLKSLWHRHKFQCQYQNDARTNFGLQSVFAHTQRDC